MLCEKFFSYHCILFDLPGHGSSPYAPSIVESIAKIIKDLATPPIIIGYSLGGRIALALEKMLPVKSLIILSSHLGLENAKEQKQRALNDALWAERLCLLSCQEFLSLWYKQSPFASLQKEPKRLASLLKKRTFTNGPELALVLKELSLSKSLRKPLPKASSLFLFGEEDRSYKNLYETFIAPSNRAVIKRASHALLEENPLEVRKKILHFLST